MVVVRRLVATSLMATWHRIPHETIPSASGRLGSLAAVGVRGRSVSLYLVVGVGRRVVVVVGGVVVWWLWWLMEERKYVKIGRAHV